jgi:hypothetical protein
VDSAVLNAALALSLSDYENAVQHESATAQRMDALVTRNHSSFRASTACACQSVVSPLEPD